jgi:ribosomal protein S18 acetylase RimI-like enzyme
MKSQVEIKLRYWTKADFNTVKEILLTTWKDTYSFIPEEDILSHFEKFYNKQSLIEILEDPFSKGIIAEFESKPVGWMKLFEDKINKRFYISSLYILPDYQGFGIGKKLLNEAYLIAMQKQYDRVWLGVMTKNVKAVDWYKNIGFVFVEEDPFQMGKTEVMHLIGYKII